MNHTLARLADLFRRIAHDAGYAMVADVPPDTVGFCRDRYERVRRRLAELAPELAAGLPPLPANASAGLVRMAARMAALTLYEAQRARRPAARPAWVGCVERLFAFD